MLLAQAAPAMAAEDAELPVTPLEASRIDAEKLPEGNLIYMGTASAAILYRYAEFKECDMSVNGALEYSDSDSVSDYAKDAVIWNTANGILQGNTDNTFVPLENTTRAQAAAVFERITKKLK